MLSELDAFTLLVSALVHDIDHPALNNSYQTNAKTPLAIKYQDISVLENHHYSCALSLLSSQKTNIFEGLSRHKSHPLSFLSHNKEQDDDEKKAKDLMKKCILGTDMAFHSTIVQSLATKVKESKTLWKEKEEDRKFLTEVLLHAADLSNASKPWELAKKWSELCVEEFLVQVPCRS